MSWNLEVVGRDKEKLKARVRAEQCQDEDKNPHNGVPAHVADLICREIDRVEIYQWPDKVFGVYVKSNGSFHSQGRGETLEIHLVQLAE